jgi:hypothetical protein
MGKQMKHISDEELVAQVYGEGDTAAVQRHLDDCAECSHAYNALKSDLAEMKFAEPPARDALDGKKMWQSISGSLPVYERRRGNWLRAREWRGWSYVAASALLVACAFFGGRIWERKQPQSTASVSSPKTQPPTAPVQQPERVVVVILSDHLDRTERLLVELKHADGENSDMVSPLSDEARSLLAANRICRENAQKDDKALTSALDRLDHLLAELANQPGGLDSATVSRLQNEMNRDGLLFEIRVLRARSPAQAAAANGTKGGKI